MLLGYTHWMRYFLQQPKVIAPPFPRIPVELPLQQLEQALQAYCLLSSRPTASLPIACTSIHLGIRYLARRFLRKFDTPFNHLPPNHPLAVNVWKVQVCGWKHCLIQELVGIRHRVHLVLDTYYQFS